MTQKTKYDVVREWLSLAINAVGVGAAVIVAIFTIDIKTITEKKIVPAVDEFRRNLSAEIEFPESGAKVDHNITVYGVVPRGATTGFLFVDDLQTGHTENFGNIRLDLSGGWSEVAKFGTKQGSCDRKYAIRVLWTKLDIAVGLNPVIPDDIRQSKPVLVIRDC